MTQQLPSDVLSKMKNNMDAAFASIKPLIEELNNQEKYLESIRLHEDAIFLAKNLKLETKPNLDQYLERLILQCNSYAMILLCHENYTDSLEMLQIADQHTSKMGYFTETIARLKLRAVTMNNIGCYYKRCGKLFIAIQYLEKALKIESENPTCDNPASTHLNICAILSQLNRHQAAADHAKCAIELLKFEKSSAEKKAHDNRSKLIEYSTDTSLLAVAYYNYGAELEHLRRFEQATSAYSKGEEVAMEEVGDGPMLKTIRKALSHSKQQVLKVRTPRESIGGNDIPKMLSPRPVSPETSRRMKITH